MVTIYHNPRCSKSREALQLLEEHGKAFTTLKYITEPLTKEQLTGIITKLGIKPIDLVRKNEAVWKENYKGKQLADNEVIDALLLYPKLIERPIVVNGSKAVVARPAEKIKDLL